MNMARTMIADPGQEDVVVPPDLGHGEVLPLKVTDATNVAGIPAKASSRAGIVGEGGARVRLTYQVSAAPVER
jgi:hypothetical protein